MRSIRTLLAGAVVGGAIVALLIQRRDTTPKVLSFELCFTGPASLAAVARFYSDSRELKRLTLTPMQVHRMDPIGER